MAMPDIRSVYFAKARGRHAYGLHYPIFANPYIGGEAQAWREGYRAAQAANGGTVYTTWPKHGKTTGFRQGKGERGKSEALRRWFPHKADTKPSRQSGAA